MRLGFLWCWLAAASLAAGCTSTKMSHTSRTGVEQLLISNAVDQALNKSDFRTFQGQNLFIEEKYLDSVDKTYILGSVRHRALIAGANLVAKPEEADIVLEVRSGGVGTDTKDSFLGMPQMSVPGPLPLSIPEVRLMSRTSQTGTAKLGLVAYDAKTKQVLGNGGVSLAKSDDNNWFVMGLGPYQNGTLQSEVRRGVHSRASSAPNELPYDVAFSPRRETSRDPSTVKLTSGDDGNEFEPAPKK